MKTHKHTALAALVIVFAAPGLMFCGPAAENEELAPAAPAPTFLVPPVGTPTTPPFFMVARPVDTTWMPPINQPTPIGDLVKQPPPPPCPDCPVDLTLTVPDLPDPPPQ